MKLYIRFLLILLSSVILAASFNYRVSFLIWVSLVLYFIVISKSSIRSAATLSFISGIIFFASITFWFTKYSWSFWVPIVFILSLFFIFYGIIFKIIYLKIRQPLLRILLISSIWTAVELFRHRTFLAFPWGVLGYFQHNYLSVMQISKITGVLGVSVLILLFNLSIAEIILYFIDLKSVKAKEKENFDGLINETESFKQITASGKSFIKTAVFKAFIVIVSVIFLNTAAGFIYLTFKSDQYSGEKLNIAVVQPNITFDDKFETDSGFLIPEKTGTHGKYFRDETELVIFPESVIWGKIELERNTTFYEWVKKTAKEENLYFIMGQIIWDENENYYNSVQLYNPELEVIGRYNKIHPLPCAEYMPYPDILGFLSFLNIAKLNITPDDKISIMELPAKGSIGSNICFESTLQIISRAYRKAGAEVLFTFTDTAGFKDSIVAWHHLIFSRTRAIENNSFMVHSGNNGISAIIDPDGRIMVKSEIIKKDVIYGTVYLNKNKSFYSKYGDIILYIYFASVFLLFLFYLIKERKKELKK